MKRLAWNNPYGIFIQKYLPEAVDYENLKKKYLPGAVGFEIIDKQFQKGVFYERNQHN